MSSKSVSLQLSDKHAACELSKSLSHQGVNQMKRYPVYMPINGTAQPYHQRTEQRKVFRYLMNAIPQVAWEFLWEEL